MGVIKPNLGKKKKTPFKRVGHALVPPAAFTAVPHYTWPQPISKQKKRGVIKLAATSTAIVSSIGLPNESNQQLFDDFEDSFDSVESEESDQQHQQTNNVNGEQVNEIQVAVTSQTKEATPQVDEGRQDDHQENVECLKVENKSQSQQRSRPRKERSRSAENKKPERRSHSKRKKRSSSKSNKNMTNEIEDAETLPMKTEELLNNEDENEEEISKTMKKLMKNLVDNKFHSSDEEDEVNERRRRFTRARLRKLKRLVETSSINSLQRALSSENESERGGIRKTKSLRSLKKRMMNSSLTSLERDFGSQLSLYEDELMMKKLKTKSSSSRSREEYRVIEESLRRCMLELHSYHEQFGEVEKTMTDKLMADSTQLPSWMTDPDKLSPLFESYDRKLRKKEEEIRVLQENLSLLGSGDSKTKTDLRSLEDSINQLREENSRLLSKCHEFSLQVTALHETLEKQVKLTNDAEGELSKTKEELGVSEAMLKEAKEEKEKLRVSMKEQKSKVDKLQDEVDDSVPKTIHNQQFKSLKTELDEVKDRHVTEISNYKALLKTAQTDLSSAQLETSSLAAQLASAEANLHSMSHDRSKLLGEMETLRQRNNFLLDQYEQGQLHLANTVRVAERALMESLTYRQVAERHENLHKDVVDKSMKIKFDSGMLHQTLKQAQVKLATQTDDVNERLRQCELRHQQEMREMKAKMKSLRFQLDERDAKIDQMRIDKQRADMELEAICKSVVLETNLMMTK